MSTPPWIRRFSEPDGVNGKKNPRSPMTSTPVNKGSFGSRSSSTLYRSTEHISKKGHTPYVDYGFSLPRVQRHSKVSSRSDDRDSSVFGYSTANSGYISDSIPSRTKRSIDSDDDIRSDRSDPCGSSLSRISGRSSNPESHHGISLNSRYTTPNYDRNGWMEESNRERSWAYVDSEGFSEPPPSVHTSASYGDFGGTASTASAGSLFIPRIRNVHSTPDVHSQNYSEDRRKYRRKRGTSNDTGTSGYSTNSISELSEFTPNFNRDENRKYKSARSPSGDRFGNERIRKSSNETGRREREKDILHTPRSSRTPDSKSSVSSSHKRSDSRISSQESDMSASSRDRHVKKSNENNKRKASSTACDIKTQSDTITQKAPTIGNVAVTVTNNIQYDPNDPFSFVQSTEVPFHVKARKCLGPIMATTLLLILAAALGAAIYFASALKETQEDQIEFLRANLAVRIRNTEYADDLDRLSVHDFQTISSVYCKQMDKFYTRSKEFSETYRGCEVLSIKDRYINFTLFFKEKEATSSQIVNVIETAAVKEVTNGTQGPVAIVDKFELELGSVKVSMERRREPETFNKIEPSVHRQTPKPPDVTDSKTVPAQVEKQIPKPDKPPLVTAKPTTKSPGGKRLPPPDTPVYSWTPCSEYEGGYFPHPVHCNMFFQCTNGHTIEHNCTTGLLYHWKELTCVSRFTPNVVCPDASKAPPRPTTTTTTTTMKTTTTTTVTTSSGPTTTVVPGMTAELTFPPDDSAYSMDPLDAMDVITEALTTTTQKTVKPLRTVLQRGYPGRPAYPADPCLSRNDVNLYPHPSDCSKFIQCVNGNVRHMSCAKNLVFDPVDSVCDLPRDDGLVCPDIRPCKGKTNGYFPHPFDCHKFVQCQAAKEIIVPCQDDLVWDQKIGGCVFGPSKCPSASSS